MKSNVLKFENNFERRMALAKARREDGDYIGALLVLKAIISEGNFPVEAYSEMARIYMDIDMIHYASEYWFKFLNVCPARDKALAYHGLGTCYYLTDYIRLAGYYYEKQLDKEPDSVYDYTEEMLDCLELITEAEKPSFHVCHPEDKIPSEVLIDRAEKYLFDADGEAAVDLLQRVKAGDENYIGARLRMVAAMLIHGKKQEGEDILKDLTDSYPNDKLPLINLVCYFADEGRREDFLNYMPRLSNFKFDDFGECYKLAVAYVKMGDDAAAEKLITSALISDPWAVSGIYLNGVIKYNLGKLEEAEKAFFKIYAMTGNPVAEFYQKLAREALSEDQRPRLSTEMIFPPAVLDDWGKRITAITTGVTAVNGKNADEALKLCDLIYSFPNAMQKEMPEALIRTKIVKIKKYFTDILLYPDISDEVKSRIITALILAGYDGKVGVVFSGMYQKVLLIPLEGVALNRKEGIVKRAYAKAFSKLCQVSNSSRKPLHQAAMFVKEKLCKNGAIGRLNDADALAAALIVLGKYPLSGNKDLLAGLMQTDKKKINSVLRIINKDDDC